MVWRPEDLLVYEYDGSIDKATPLAVVVPANVAQVSAIVRVCQAAEVPLVPRGAGTGLSGGAIALDDSVQLVMSRFRRILSVDVDNRTAIVEPGVVNADLSTHVAQFGLYYVPDPSSQKACTIGGNVAENAGGPHCLAYGVTTNHVLGMEVVLASGEVTWLGGETRETPGYDLRGAFIGSEGMFGIATKVAVRLLPLPEAVQTMVASFRSLDEATQTVSDIIGSGVVPAAIEMIDKVTIAAVEPFYHPGYPPDAEAVLLVEVDGIRETVAEEAAHIEAVCRKNGASDFRSSDDPVRRAELWATRKGAIGAFGNLRPNYYLVDGVVPRTKLQETMRKISDLAAEMDVLIANVFHAGDGNLHPCILFDEREPGAVEKTISAGERILEMCIEAGGALSGEHGIGIEKRAYMGLMYNADDLAAMAGLKSAFGAGEFFNPLKVFPSGRDLHGAAYRGAIRRTGTADVI